MCHSLSIEQCVRIIRIDLLPIPSVCLCVCLCVLKVYFDMLFPNYFGRTCSALQVQKMSYWISATSISLIITSPPQSNLGRVCHSRTTMNECPNWLQSGTKKSTLKLPLPLWRQTPYLKTIPQWTPLPTPNGVQIHSTILPQYTFWTDQTIGSLVDKPVPRVFMLYWQTAMH